MPPLVIPVFIPHMGCPHQCAFCNQTTLTPKAGQALPATEEIHQTIDQYLAFQGKRERVELAFYGGNFLGLAPHQITVLLQAVTPYLNDKQIHGIRFSTRPDTITPETLDLIREFPVCLIELGIQSMSDTVLSAANRGHTAQQARDAMDAINAAGIPLGVQVMVGLPRDTRQTMLATARTLVEYHPKTARIYPLLVLAHSPLALAHGNGDYAPLSLETALDVTKALYPLFTQAGTRVIRMGLQASDFMEDRLKVIAGPWHPAFGHLVFCALALDEILYQINTLSPAPGDTVTLLFHPSDQSRIRGDKNTNLTHLQTQYPHLTFTLRPDPTLTRNQIRIR